MEEVTSNMTIAVIMDYLICHEMEYSGRKDPIFTCHTQQHQQNHPSLITTDSSQRKIYVSAIST